MASDESSVDKENMSNEDNVHDVNAASNIESKITKIISKIKENRARPYYQSILTFYNHHEDTKIEMDDLKRTILNMLEKEEIINKGSEHKESFVCNESDDAGHGNINEDDLNDGEDETENVETFINKSFYETLTNKIKEVELSVNGKIHALIHNQLKSVNPPESSITECHQEIKDALNKQILFLQDELRSKDEIIKLLINERNVTNNDYSVHKQNVNKRKNTNSSNENNKDVSKEQNNTSINMDNNSEYVVVGKKKNTKRRSITIMGDSMLKEVNPFKMRKDLKDTSDRLYVHSFIGATVEHMRHYAKPLMGFKLDLVILHAGTNSLRGDILPKKVAEEIVTLATELQKDETEVIVSSILPRRDIEGEGRSS